LNIKYCNFNLENFGAEDLLNKLKNNNKKVNNDEIKKEMYSKIVTFGFLTYYDGKKKKFI